MIDLLEERPSLWDMFGSEYTKRQVREAAYKEIAEVLGENWTLSEITSKIINLQVQLGRELKKTTKTKSGQSKDEAYRSTWAHWDRIQFLVPQVKPGSTADTIALQDKDFDKNMQSREINDDNEEEAAPKAKRKSFAKKMEERKIQLLKGLANALETPKAPQGNTPSSFAIYVNNKLKQMDARSHAITEKRIMDTLFEAKMGTTCVISTQRQSSISMRPAEAQYSNAATPVHGQYSSGIRPAEAQYLNATTPVQGKYWSGMRPVEAQYLNATTPVHEKYSSAIRSAEARYSNATAPVQGKYSSGIRTAEAQYSNATSPVQGQY